MQLPLQTALAQAQENCQENTNVSNQNETGITRKKRRRPGGVNRDCKRKEIEINPETGEVKLIEQQATTQVPRSIMARKFSSIPRPQIEDFKALTPIPDRWRIVDTLGYQERWYDPYNQNVLKADKPIYGDDWFLNLDMISDAVFENRDSTIVNNVANDNGLEALKITQHRYINQNLALGMVYYQGDTTFKPPDYQFRFMPVLNYNHSPARTDHSDHHVGIQALFIEKHLTDVSSNYDFDSVRFGIQPMTSDYRGFVLLDSPFGVRLFGTRKNYQYQYNIGLFRRLKKDQNSGLNEANLSFRDDDILIANLYLQDQPKAGLTSQFTVIHNRNRDTYNSSSTRRSYDVTYLGYNMDGHWDRLNLSSAAYYAFGDETRGVFNDQSSDISAFFLASEFSIDFDWIRFSASLLYGSGDNDPTDRHATGFDAIDENPQFAGGDASYWMRQSNALLTAGGNVSLSARNGILNTLRLSNINSQSNFTNPGTTLLGVGAELEVLPELSFSMNTNYIRINETAPLENISTHQITDKNMGIDVSIAAIYRPLNSQNIVFRLSYARLFAGKGFKQLLGDGNPDALLLNVILTY